MHTQHFLRHVSNTQYIMYYVGDRYNFLSYILYYVRTSSSAARILSAVRENVFLHCCKLRALVLSIGNVRNCLF